MLISFGLGHNDTLLIWLEAYSSIVPAIVDDGVTYSRRSLQGLARNHGVKLEVR